jgi:hypothetical protein
MCGQTRAELGRSASKPDDVIHGLARELRLALGHKEPWQIVFLRCKVALDGAQLVAGCSARAGQTIGAVEQTHQLLLG